MTSLQKLAQAAIGAGDAIRANTPAATEELQRLVDEALAASARVHLLFGVLSPTVTAANRALSAYKHVLAHLESDPVGCRNSISGGFVLVDQAAEQLPTPDL
jgi:hypothetical protein